MYTTTSEIIARLGVLENKVTFLLAEIKLMSTDLIENGVIIYEDGQEKDRVDAQEEVVDSTEEPVLE